ncbi:MAG: hypothetical protein ACR2OF_00955 [Hyphomicrobium sp.]
MSSVTADTVMQETQAMVREAAEPRPIGDSVKSAILRASVFLRQPYPKVRRWWYGEAMPSAPEYLETKRRLEQRRERQIAQAEQQVALAYARCRDNRDAFVRTLVEIVGPGHPMVRKLGGCEVSGTEPVASQEDGEA